MEAHEPMRLKELRTRLRPAREPLPSLFDRFPAALAASRHPRGVRVVPISSIVGTARHPSQNTLDFLPLPQLRGTNWESRWQRILAATKQLAILPPVELLQVGDDYYIVDGHNRVAAALRNGAVAVDADVTELLIPGQAAEGHVGAAQISLIGSEEVRQAGEGRWSPTSEMRRGEPTRIELAQRAEELEVAEAAEEEARHPTKPADERAAESTPSSEPE
jgi:hypothetical protein